MLKTLRTKTRKIMLATLILVIPSFIFFYGWGSIRGKQAQDRADTAAYGTFKTAEDSDWVVLNREDILFARYVAEPKIQNYVAQLVMNRFQQFMPDKSPSYQDLQAEISRLGGMDSLMPSEDLKYECINMHLLTRYADKMGVKIGEEDLKKILGELVGQYPAEYRRRALEARGLPGKGYESYLSRGETQMRAKLMLSSQGQMSKFELWELFRAANEKIGLDFVDFPVTKFKDQVQVADKDLEAYYNDHKEDFRVGAKRRYAYAILPRKAIEQNVGPFQESEIQAYYDAHKETYEEPQGARLRQIVAKFDEKPNMTEPERTAMTSATLQKVEGFKAQLKADNSNFGDLANSLSEDPDNAPAGGASKLDGRIKVAAGWLTEKDSARFGAAFITAALALKKGEVSKPVVLEKNGQPFGYAVILCDDVRQAGTPALETIRDRMLGDMRKQYYTESIAIWNDYLTESGALKSYTSIPGLAKDLGMECGETTWALTTAMSLPTEKKGVMIRLGQEDLSYVNDSLTLSKTEPAAARSELIVSNSPTGAPSDVAVTVLQLIEEKPSEIPPLADHKTKTQVTDAYKTVKARELMKKAAEDFAAQSKDLETMKKLATEQKLEVSTTTLFTRNSPAPELPGELTDFVSDSLVAKKGDVRTSAVEAFGSKNKEADHYVVWCLREVEEADRKKFDEQLPTLLARTMTSKQYSFLEEWLLDHRNSLKMKEEAAAAAKGKK